jgi:hypothetical protein
VALAAAWLLWVALGAGLGAHNAAQARLSFDAPGAVAGQPSVVLVQFEPADGIDEELKGGQVRIVATMSGHAMPPVEVSLRPTGVPGRYRGEMEFSMAGPWRLWFRAEGVHGVTVGTAGIDVAGQSPSPQVAKVMVLVQQPSATAGPEAPLPYSPWAVVLGALALTAGLMSLAVVRKLVVSRRVQPASSAGR